MVGGGGTAIKDGISNEFSQASVTSSVAYISGGKIIETGDSIISAAE